MQMEMWTTRWGQRALAAIVLAAGLGLAPAPAAAAVPVLVLDGTGYGHGVGLSQWGAEYLARTGHTTYDILGTFYPGVQLAEATGPMRVAVHKPAVGTTNLTFPQGGEVRSAPQGPQARGFPVRVGAGGKVRILFDGTYRVTALVTGQSVGRPVTFQQDEPCTLLGSVCPSTTAPPATTTTIAPTSSTAPGGSGTGGSPTSTVTPPARATASSGSAVTAVPASGGVTNVDDRGRAYRGAIEANAAGGLRLINIVGVEDYLRGMAEVPSTWPAAAVQAQTIAARTYALRAMESSGEICDDARCQVYVGANAESAGQNAAVAATAKRVLAYDGRLAAAVYSADAGGVSANAFEGFGTPDGVYPYLRNVAYDTDNPLPWHLLVGLDELASRFGYPGTVSGARVGDQGPSGRALEVVLEGSAGDKVVDGHQFARSLGLRSTRFEAKLGSSDGTPLPPRPTEESIQALPDETAALALHPVDPDHDLRLGHAELAPDGLQRGALPDALDPRRHPATLIAVLLVGMVLVSHAQLVFARRPATVRTSPRWRTLTRSR